MNLTERIESFQLLHQKLQSYSQEELLSVAYMAEQNNPWFTENNFFSALEGIKTLISSDSLNAYLEEYKSLKDCDKELGLILAGNIPGVGFHDVLIGLLAGCTLKVKLSSEDKILIPFLIKELKTINPKLAEKCEFIERLDLDSLDGVVATGSDNTARYFEQYFSRKPNLIRKSRTSVAILRGDESQEELTLLVDDIVSYFGLGCRNVSKVLLLGETDIIPLLQLIEMRTELGAFAKYDNNYLYYKSIYLVNREPFLDTENMLFRETEILHSPISVLFYQKFATQLELDQYILENVDKLQCIIGKNEPIAFGQSQKPSILDYADGVDLRLFIEKI